MGRLSYWPADTSQPVLDLTTGELLRAAAEDAGTQTALVEVAPPGSESLVGAASTNRRWTYAELLRDAEQAAHWLLTRFSPGERITIWAPNIPEWAILQYAAALAGIVIVTANPALRAPELRYVLEQSRSAGLFHTAAFRGTDMTEIAGEAAEGLPELRSVLSFSDWRTTAGAPRDVSGDLPAVRPGDAAQIQYTSGTTGFPKGALLHHRGLVANAKFMIERTGLPARGVSVSAMPLFHTAGCAMGVLGAAHQRASFVLCQLFDPGLVLAAAAEYRADMLGGVPTMLIAMLGHPGFDRFDLSSVSRIISGGSPVPADLVRQAEERFGALVTEVYGQTELSPVITQTFPGDPVDVKTASSGRPLPHTEVTILDPDRKPVPFGQPGEICVRGYQVMLGYFEMPERTADTIDPDGWLHTGDLGTLDERGNVRVTGRLKDMIIRGGENIYSSEIEQVLFTHPALRDVSVLGLPDPAWGEIVAAVLVPAEPGRLPPVAELRDFCRQRLAPHKTPARWFSAPDLPLTGSGKIQKFRLREQIDSAELTELPSG